MGDYRFKLDFKVRDYECDMQGIVNNSVYQNYLEHTRHEFLHTVDVDFAALAEEGVNLIVVRAELDYKSPLRAGDKFWVGLRMEQVSKIRFAFFQDIYNYNGDKLVLNGKVIASAMNSKGRPFLPDALRKIIEG